MATEMNTEIDKQPDKENILERARAEGESSLEGDEREKDIKIRAGNFFGLIMSAITIIYISALKLYMQNTGIMNIPSSLVISGLLFSLFCAWITEHLYLYVNIKQRRDLIWSIVTALLIISCAVNIVLDIISLF